MIAGLSCDRSALTEYLARQRAELVEADEEEGRDWIHEREAFVRLCAHWFSAGPQPEEVLQRVFAAASERRADLLKGLSKKEIALAREEGARGRKWRLQALFPGEESLRARYREIVGTLAAAFNGAHRPEIAAFTLNEALRVGRDGGEPPEATETLSRVLETIFSAGVDPRAVAQHTFALTGWLFRNLQLNMPLESLGRLFAEERATQSWRSKKFVEAMLREAGFRGCKAGWQKPESACAHYRESARGNQNRRCARRAPFRKKKSRN